jgi:hypothetical protein
MVYASEVLFKKLFPMLDYKGNLCFYPLTFYIYVLNSSRVLLDVVLGSNPVYFPLYSKAVFLTVFTKASVLPHWFLIPHLLHNRFINICESVSEFLEPKLYYYYYNLKNVLNLVGQILHLFFKVKFTMPRHLFFT